jgi:hypothetical protein
MSREGFEFAIRRGWRAKARKMGDNHPSAKADGNTCMELFLFPLRQLKLSIPLAKADGNTKRWRFVL